MDILRRNLFHGSGINLSLSLLAVGLLNVRTIRRIKIIAPAASFLLSVVWYARHKKWSFSRYVLAAAIFSLINIGFAASVPVIQRKYMLASGEGTLNSYFMFLFVYIIFWICCTIYLVSNLLSEWKERSPGHKYWGTNLFFFGQIISKLSTASKTMTLICLTFVLAVFLFVAAPA